MATLSVPLTPEQERFIASLVKSGQAANKAHAVRLAIDSFAEEEAIRAVQEAERELAQGKGLKGDLSILLKKYGRG